MQFDVFLLDDNSCPIATEQKRRLRIVCEKNAPMNDFYVFVCFCEVAAFERKNNLNVLCIRIPYTSYGIFDLSR